MIVLSKATKSTEKCDPVIEFLTKICPMHHLWPFGEINSLVDYPIFIRKLNVIKFVFIT